MLEGDIIVGLGLFWRRWFAKRGINGLCHVKRPGNLVVVYACFLQD